MTRRVLSPLHWDPDQQQSGCEPVEMLWNTAPILRNTLLKKTSQLLSNSGIILMEQFSSALLMIITGRGFGVRGGVGSIL